MRTILYVSLILLLLGLVWGQTEEYHVFVFDIPTSLDVVVDASAIGDAIVGVGVDYDSIHRTNASTFAVHVFGTDALVTVDSSGKIVVNYKTPPENPPACGSGFSTMPNVLICVLMIVLCSGRRINFLVLLLCVLVIMGSVSSIPPVRIIVYLPEVTLDAAEAETSPVKTLTVNAKAKPMVSPELATTNGRVTVTCQVNGAVTPCGSQICTKEDTSCRISDGTFIGVLAPLTGPNAANGPILQEAITYYVNVDGFTVPYIQFLFCDTQADATKAVSYVDDLYKNSVTSVFIGPASSSEATAIMAKYDDQVILISPTVTAGSLAAEDTFISLSMSNSQYVVAMGMIIENDFNNALENVILIYRNDAYGQDIYQQTAGYFEGKIYSYAYNPDGSDIATVVQQAGSYLTTNGLNNTAVMIAAFGEVSQILSTAKTNSILNTVPWYAVSLSFNTGIIDPSVVDFSIAVNFKTLEYRGSNIEAHTADRTRFYEVFSAKFNRSIPASAALGFDAALLIANTPEIFETTAKQGYFLLSKQGDITFGLSGWLSIDDTGFRANGDFISQLVEDKNVYGDKWVEIGYVELDKHKISQAKDSAYYEITFRVVSNYHVPGNWSLGCSPSKIYILARNIDRQWIVVDSIDNPDVLDATSSDDISAPLYDTFFIQYVCTDESFTQFCPSALYGSDTQCIQLPFDLFTQKRATLGLLENLQTKDNSRVVCTNAANSKGCVVAGAPGGCPRTNSTCASEGFKDACGKNPKFCKKP